MTQDEKRIREQFFKNHIATYRTYISEDFGIIEKVKWINPKSSVHSVIYLFKKGTLFVYGDLGEAIYRWYGNITFKLAANCDLTYFHSKCAASCVGRHFNEWEQKKARLFLSEYFESEFLDKLHHEPEILTINISDPEEIRKKAKEEYVKSSLQYITEENCGEEPWSSKENWEHFIGDHGNDIFGEDYWEYNDIGTVINTRCFAQKIGLEMAFKQLDAKKTTIG